MNKKEEKKGFHFVYWTEEDSKREIEEQVSKLTEDQKSEFIFDEYSLYVLGRGHSFLLGFFTEYVTKNKIKACSYDSGLWYINGNSYNHINDEFILIPKLKHGVNINLIDFSNLFSPTIKNCGGRTLAEDLISVMPI